MQAEVLEYPHIEMEKGCSSFVQAKIPHELMPELCLAWGGPVGSGFLLQGEDTGATAGDHSTRRAVRPSGPPSPISVWQSYLHGVAPTLSSSENPLSISPANPEGSWPPPLLPNQSKLGFPGMGLPGVDRPPACSLTAGNCKPPHRETLCWRAIPNLCSNYYSQM